MATAGLVGQYPVTTFVSPVNGSSPIDGNTVRNQDNVNGSTYTTHDADPTIHFQSSTLAARPAFGTVGRKWLSTDTLQLWYDTGAAWSPVVARGTGGLATDTAYGVNALNAVSATGQNSAFGNSALSAMTSGSTNTGLGYHAGRLLTTGSSNTVMGANALAAEVAGNGNTAIGAATLTGSNGGTFNTAVGYFALNAVTTGDFNCALGQLALSSVTTGSSNVAVGQYAGAYETGSNAFYVDNQDRTDAAGDKAKALCYGVFNAAAASQTIRFNVGRFQISNIPTAAAGLSSGDVWSNAGVLTIV